VSGAVKIAARLVAILGAVAVASLLFGRAPKDVTVVYDVSGVPAARALEVDVVRGAEVLRHAEFRLAASDHGRVKHELRLQEGEYLLRGRIDAPAGPTPFERPLEVHDSETIVLALGR
jgi:hypothetical protein